MKSLYAARIEDLGLNDFVKVECTAYGHVELLAADKLRIKGLPLPPVLDLEPRLRAENAMRAARQSRRSGGMRYVMSALPPKAGTCCAPTVTLHLRQTVRLDRQLVPLHTHIDVADADRNDDHNAHDEQGVGERELNDAPPGKRHASLLKEPLRCGSRGSGQGPDTNRPGL